jgi:hypothetical protein
MKHVEARPYAKPESAARHLLEICREIEAKQDGAFTSRSSPLLL